MTDGDWFEQRKKDNELVCVAYIETIQIPNMKNAELYPIWDSKKKLCQEIEKKMDIPAFIVWNDINCSKFFVKKISRDKIMELTESEYISFLKGL